MAELREYRFIGGPWDGQRHVVPAGEVQLVGYPRMSYYRTKVWTPPDYDRYAFPPQPEPTCEHVMEWHRRGWESAETAAIKDAVREGTARLRGEG